MRNNSFVASVEQDQVVNASALHSVRSLSWGLDRIDQRASALDGRYTYDDTAAPVNVYVLDTGILTSHTQFEGRAVPGYNFVDNNANSNDCNGHGTHCAGTIAGKDYGVCKHCRLIAVKVLACGGSGTLSSLISGINWAISHAQSTGIPSVISMSLGTQGVVSALNAAVTSAVNAGIVTVVAAGNDNADACNYSPASTPSAITVGAVSSSTGKSSYSNFGSCVDIFAPGDNIPSAWIGSNTAVMLFSGTSQATPHVAGVAAIYRSYNPSKTALQIRDDIVQSATANAISGLDALSPNALLYAFIGPPQFKGNVVTIGGVVFGTTQFGYYAFRPSSTSDSVLISYFGKFASQSYPAGGWVCVGVVPSVASRFTAYWRNSINQQYAIWELDAKGMCLSSSTISY
jgi:serine protease